MPESLNSPVSGKAVFMEFGPPSQQMSPSPMSHGHYSMHCLHSAGHSQPDSSYSTASSFSRPLGYPYVNSVSSHSTNPYISSVQSYPNSSSLTQTRLEETGRCTRLGAGGQGRQGGREDAWIKKKKKKSNLSGGIKIKLQNVSQERLRITGEQNTEHTMPGWKRNQPRCARISLRNYLLRSAINNVCN